MPIRGAVAAAVCACILAAGLLFSAQPYEPQRKRVPFEKWPQTSFEGVRILFASEQSLSWQGFAGARAEEFAHTIIVFPHFSRGATFTNRDYGYGPVVCDLKIYFLDSSYRVVKESVMKRLTGESKAPDDAVMAIEGLPGSFEGKGGKWNPSAR